MSNEGKSVNKNTNLREMDKKNKEIKEIKEQKKKEKDDEDCVIF